MDRDRYIGTDIDIDLERRIFQDVKPYIERRVTSMNQLSSEVVYWLSQLPH